MKVISGALHHPNSHKVISSDVFRYTQKLRIKGGWVSDHTVPLEYGLKGSKGAHRFAGGSHKD